MFPSSKLAELYAEAERMYNLVMKAATVETDEDGNIINVYVPKDAQFWFTQMRRIATEVSKMSTFAQISSVDQKINLIKTLINGAKSLPQDMREQIAQQLLGAPKDAKRR